LPEPDKRHKNPHINETEWQNQQDDLDNPKKNGSSGDDSDNQPK
jgi:hypothetical protein